MNSTITKNQLAALLLIPDLFTLMCYKGSLSASAAAGLAAGIILQFFLMLPLVLMTAKGKTQPKLLSYVLLVWLTASAGVQVFMFVKASEAVFVQAAEGFSGKLTILLLAAPVCAYITLSGLKAAARSALIIAATGILLLMTDFASAVSELDIGNISASSDKSCFKDGLLLSAVQGMDIGAFAVLLPLVRDGAAEAAVRYFSCRLVLSIAAVITTLLAVGGIMQTAEYPVVMAAQLSQPFTAQRIDSLFLMLFAAFAVFSVSVQLIAFLTKCRS